MQISGRFDLFEVLLNSLNFCAEEFSLQSSITEKLWAGWLGQMFQKSVFRAVNSVNALLHRRAEKGRERNSAYWSCKL